MKNFRTFIITVFILIVAATGICSEVSTETTLEIPRLLDRQTVLEAASKVSRRVYPDAEEVLVATLQKMEYEADGTYVQWHEEYVKILTEESRRAHQTMASYFTIPYQRGPEDCSIAKLEIIRSDGTVVPIDVEAESRVMVNPGSMSANIYNPNDKLIQVNISDLQIGDVLHFVLYDRIVKARMENTWSDWLVFEGGRPILSSVVEISGPETMPLKSIAHKDEIAGTVSYSQTEADGRIYYRWEAKDVPRMFPEPSMPPPHTVLQRVLVSTISDWEYISRWYWNLSEPHYEVNIEIEEKVRDLIKGLEAPGDIMEVLFKFVSQEIRYMGITVEATSPGYEPHDVTATFEARHGVCRDKAALLVAMLRLAGLQAYPTLIHNGTKKDKEVPQPYFNHAIVAVKLDSDSIVLMDPTDETTTELLPAYLSDKSYLIASPEGDPLRTSPIVPAEENMMRVSTIGKLDASGNLVAETILEFIGINDNAYRGLFARRKPEERRRFFEGLVKRAAAGARIDQISIEPEDMTDTSTTLTVRIHYKAEDVLIGDDGLVMFPLPLIGARVGMVNFIVGQTGLKKRKYPLVTGMACGVREQMDIELDPVFTDVESLPSATRHDADALSWELESTINDRRLSASDSFVLKGVEFSPEEYLDLKSTLKLIEQDYRKMPILRKERAEETVVAEQVDREAVEATAEADMEVLQNIVEYNLIDGHSWTETSTMKARILTYAGKKDNSEIKIGYNEGWEDVKVEYAFVTNPDGDKKEISEDEINVMDASWVGAAPRYPKGKLLVASLPAVDIGSVIEYKYQRSCRDRPFFNASSYFRILNDIKEKIVRVSVPRELQLTVYTQLFELANVTASLKEADGRRVYEWRVEDVPAVKREDSIPPWWVFNPSLFLSAGEWGEYTGEVKQKLLDAASTSEKAAALAQGLISGIEDPRSRLERIRDFVAINIRRVGPGLGVLPCSSISSADLTLESGYGNTTDRAILHYAMLKAAGFSPEFVLVSGLPVLEEVNHPFIACPDLHAFTEVVVRLADPDLGLPEGQYIYFNDTDQYDALGTSANEDQLSLNLNDGVFGKISPEKKSLREMIYGMDVDDEGNAVISRKLLLSGRHFGRDNKLFAEMQPEERRRYYRELIADISQGAESEGDLFTDFTRYPGVVEFAVWVPNYAIKDKGYLYFPLVDSLSSLFRMRADTRTNPLYFPLTSLNRLEMNVSWPDEFSVQYAPASIQEKNIGGSHIELDIDSRASGKEKNAWRIRAEVNLKPSIVDASQYGTFLKFDKKLSHQRERTLLLKETP